MARNKIVARMISVEAITCLRQYWRRWNNRHQQRGLRRVCNGEPPRRQNPRSFVRVFKSSKSNTFRQSAKNRGIPFSKIFRVG
jgi:hypothetical protein